MRITVHPATAQRWDDIVAVFAGRGGSTCWCQRFRRPGGTDRSTALRDEIERADAPVGLIAYVGDEPAGWSRVVMRTSLLGIAENRALQRLYAQDNADPAWWISCFAVRRAHRGGGVGVSLLRAATQFANRQGAAVLDGHPVDVDRLSARPSPAAVFTGTMSMFTAAGFHEIGRTYPSRPVMRHLLERAG
ncbi:GNAT superfamily N-acetyltransferase [Nakamurella sp. UYEF19]|uniref:GNAT family N-acetyltransferase n=1 Tax=Nakamurella sp. UYEF19 TaxID=1756392 RepID=UPI0033994ABC